MTPLQSKIGRYEILEELGHGAMGSVFKAHDPAMGRTVALKTILSAALAGQQSDEYRMRFFREARAAGSLAHPGIVPVFDVGEDDGTPYLVMEFVEGRTLSEAMKSGEGFTLDQVCEIGQQIAEALGHAHHKGVIHRDIKPANILMTSREAYGSERARITDFGVAKLSAGNVTSTGQLLGTPAFMPPEQFTGAPIDGRADLFSLGVILYSLATREQPFQAETLTAVSYKVVHTEPVAPRQFNPGIPVQLERVILKCLAKSPDERYQTGEELAQELAAIRGVAPASVMRTAPLTAPPPAGSNDATVDGHSGGISLGPGGIPKADIASSAVGVMRSGVVTGGRRVRPMMIAIAAVALVCLAAGGWLLARSRNRAAPVPPQQIAASTPAPGGTAATPTLVPAVDQPSTAPATSVPAAVTEAKPSPAAAAPAAPAPAAGLGFDPKSLDPKTNAKLKIELSHFPQGQPYTVEMNRKVYLNGVSGGNIDNLFVPPGVHEFRVVVKSGGQHKVSNIVSDDFKAKKKKTLKIDWQARGKGAPGRDAQVFVTLK